MDQPRVLTARRVAIALALAAGLAAGLTALRYALAVYQSPHWDQVKSFAPANIAFVFGGAFLVWLIGLLLFGGPVWFFLHRAGYRRLRHAVLAGFGVPFVILLAVTTGVFTGSASGNWSLYANGGQQWADGRITGFGWRMALQASAMVGGIGAVVEFVVWQVAYRRR